MFEMTYEDESWTGTYSIEDITYTVDGKEYSLNFKKCGIEGKFAVNQICETDPDAVVEGEKTEKNTDISDADISFTAITQDGTVHEEDSIADVINDAIDTQSADSQIATMQDAHRQDWSWYSIRDTEDSIREQAETERMRRH